MDSEFTTQILSKKKKNKVLVEYILTLSWLIWYGLTEHDDDNDKW